MTENNTVDQLELEGVYTRNVLKVLDGADGELAVAVLSKVLAALMAGIAKDKVEAKKYVSSFTKHVKGEIDKFDVSEFGYLLNDQQQDDPILATAGNA